jgi:gliding motility-associated-like protein
MKYIFTCLLIFLLHTSHAQNIVPDSSFESYLNCPDYMGQVSCPLTPGLFLPTLTEWYCPIPTSTDYNNDCSLYPFTATTNNYFGPQLPHTGDGYICIVAYNIPIGYPNLPQSSYREYIACQLTQPLIAGQVYNISCYVKIFARSLLSFSGGNFYAVDRFAANFSNGLITSPVSPLSLSCVPLQLPSQGFITDTTWVKINGEYTATGGEDHLIIGTFNDGVVPALQHFFPTPPIVVGEIMSYYMMDDVSLRTKCDTTITTHDTTLCAPQITELFPNGTGMSYKWCTGATSQFISVASAGTYWRIATTGCNANIDTFDVRLFTDTISNTHDTGTCATTNVLTLNSIQSAASYQWNTGATSQNISVNDPGTYYCTAIENCLLYTDTFHVTNYSTFTSSVDTIICFPSTASLAAVKGATSYSWNTGQTTPSIFISEPGIFSYEAIKECDLYMKQYNITAKPSLRYISLGDDVIMCKESKTTIGSKYENARYLWNTGDTTFNIIPAVTGVYTLQVDDGCKLLYDTIAVDIVGCENCIYMPTAFTPNGDGKNDDISAIINCPLTSYSLIIVNRFGEVVFSSKNVLEKWNGLYKGTVTDVGTYYYLIHYTTSGNGKVNLLKGDLTLIH